MRRTGGAGVINNRTVITAKYRGRGLLGHAATNDSLSSSPRTRTCAPRIARSEGVTTHGCFNHARFGILVSAHARYHDAVLPLGLFVEELYLCLEVILRNRTWRTLKVKVRNPISVV